LPCDRQRLHERANRYAGNARTQIEVMTRDDERRKNVKQERDREGPPEIAVLSTSKHHRPKKTEKTLTRASFAEGLRLP